MSQAQGGVYPSPDFLTPIATPPIANIVASSAEVAALAAAGTPAPKSTLLVDPTTKLLYGQSDGVGGYVALGGAGGSAYLGTVAATGDLAALPAAIGSTADVGSGSSAVTYELKTLPASVEANWQALQGTIADGTAIVLTIVPGKTERQLLVWVAAATEVTVTDGTSTFILYPSTNPHVIPIYDEPGSASPASVSIQRTSGTATTGRFSLED